MAFFTELEKNPPKFIWKHGGYQISCWCDAISSTHNLNEEKLNEAHGTQRLSPWSTDWKAGAMGCKALAEGSCCLLPHDTQETLREHKGVRKETGAQKTPPSKGCTSSAHIYLPTAPQQIGPDEYSTTMTQSLPRVLLQTHEDIEGHSRSQW